MNKPKMQNVIRVANKAIHDDDHIIWLAAMTQLLNIVKHRG